MVSLDMQAARGRFSPLLWTRVALGLGLGLRLFHYFRGLSVWHDEAALILNVLDKSFTELLGSLYFHEAAPPGFLWLEKAVSLVLGDAPWVLRMFPLLASCLALWFFARLAWLWLAPAAVPWAVLLFACSDRLLWHACEAKPYSLDVLLAVLTLYVYQLTRSWTLDRRLLLFSLATPPLILFSYPGCFLCGGLMAAELPCVWRQHSWRSVLGYTAWAGAAGVSFLLLLAGPIRAQRDAALTACWSDMFPSWSRPWSNPWWVLDSTLQVIHYAVNPIGEFAGVLCLASAWLLWQRGERGRLAVQVIPVVLALAASCIHVYPYGRTRVMAYAAPAAILLLAGGFLHVWHWLRQRWPVLAGLLGAIMLLPLANTAWRLATPWVRTDAAEASAFVLAHLDSDEQVVGNAWELTYYFRRMPRNRYHIVGETAPSDQAVWAIVLSSFPEERAAVVAGLCAGRNLLEVREFSLVTVAHLSRGSRH